MGAVTDRHLWDLRSDGYVVVENLLDTERLAAVRRGLEPFLGAHRGRNPFEGHTTERVYTLAARAPVFSDLAIDPDILSLIDPFLRPGYLLTAGQAINILPGEAQQNLHSDDSQFMLPRPRPPVTMAVILAIDAFTAQNGATVVIPGSHRWGEAELQFVREARAAGRSCALLDGLRPIEMPSGAGVFLQGTLIHAGGANRSDKPRLALTNQYCEPWGRTQENFFLSVPRERVRGFPPRLRQMMGYDVWSTFVGHVSSTHPAKSLEPDFIPPILRQEPRSDGL